MPTTKYYPSISDHISIDDLPDILNFLKDDIQQAFDKIYYKNLQISKNIKGDTAFYNLEVISKKRLDLEIPGTGIFLILNPDYQVASISSFPIMINWEWKILRYKKYFKTSSFSFLPKDFFNLLIDIFQVTKEEVLDIALKTFVVPSSSSISRFIQLVNDINQIHNVNISVDEFSDTQLEELANEIIAIGESPYISIFSLYILQSDLQITKEKINHFFSTFLPTDFEAFIEQLIKPKIRTTLTLSAAIEFPRKFLKPVYDADGVNPYNVSNTGVPYEVIPSDNEGYPKVQLNFGETLFYADTEQGLGYNVDLVLNTNVPAQIGNTGLIIDINNLKLDLSKKTNILEADLDGRPVDFVGAYLEYAEIGLPKKWFKQESGATLAIIARKTLIGTGGISGTIGLEAIGGSSGRTARSSTELVYKFSNGFKLGFKHFHLVFYQNAVIESSIKGSLTIPKFKQCGATGPLHIDIEVFFENDGDFKMTADIEDGLTICFGSVFQISLDSLSVGKDDNKAFLCVSGSLSFENNAILSQYFKEPFTVEKLCIYSDGTFEIEGGSLPLPGSIEIPIGPAKIAITNIHIGSHEENGRKYKFFGFDGGVNINPGGVDAKGNGCKYYFSTDNGSFHDFFRIDGIALDLVIPGNVPKKDATLLIQGFLSIKENYYQGALAFQLPKAKIAGGAFMKYETQYPAWLLDVHLKLSTPILLGNTNLGIFGFRGLFGFRYLATKQAADLTDENTWFDYYVAPQRGLNYDKFEVPDNTKGAKNPISIGAGISLGTASDTGKVFNADLFLLISLPNVIFLEGKADILGKGIGSNTDSFPFFSFLSIAPGDSIEVGMGADYKLRDNGKLLTLKAEVQAAFFFKNHSAWYLYLGTDKKPITALVFGFIRAYSYLMLNAKGIQMGAGTHLDFQKNYGPVRAKVAFYFDVWGKISFEQPQIGAGANVGGTVDVSVFGLGFFISFAAGLSVEVPEPFRIYGYVELCVGFKLLVKRIEKCFTVKFEWEKPGKPNTDPIALLPVTASIDPAPVTGIHIPTGNTYPINYFGERSTPPSSSAINEFVPLDTYIDIQFKKSLDPSAVAHVIGGATQSTSRHIEMIPPKASNRQRQVKHTYKIENVEISIWDTNAKQGQGDWINYHPYEALTQPTDIIPLAPDFATLKSGYWQKSDLGFNKFRLLAQTIFNYTEPVGDFVPEQAGLTTQRLFCEELPKNKKHCVQFKKEEQVYAAKQWHFYEKMLFRVSKKAANVEIFQNAFDIPLSLRLDKTSLLEIHFPEPTHCIELKLSTYGAFVEVSYYKKAEAVATDVNGDGTLVMVQDAEYELVEKRTLTQNALQQTIKYEANNPEFPKPAIQKITIASEQANAAQIRQCELDLEDMKRNLYENITAFPISIETKKSELQALRHKGCKVEVNVDREKIQAIYEKNEQDIYNCKNDIIKLEEQFKKECEGIGDQPNPKPQIGQIPINSKDNNKCDEIKAILTTKQKQLKSLELKRNKLDYILNNWEDYVAQHTTAYCGTYLHQVCWQTEADNLYNQSIPTQQAIQADVDAMQESLQKTLSPIWRPNSTFLIKLDVKDTVHFSSSTSHSSTYYCGFKTSGPIGHFTHFKEPVVPVGENTPTELVPPKPEFPETSLKFYINYQKSYPNANGELNYAKPLYYENPSLSLFYTKPYVWHFLNDWPAYQGLPELKGNLDIKIKDPTEDGSQLGTGSNAPVLEQLPITAINWIADPNPRVPEDVKMLNKMLSVNPCLAPKDAIRPPSPVTKIEASHLLPLKLYTAVVNNHFEGEKAEVHRYVFQTSRYPNFKKHIYSYQLQGTDNSVRDAIFEVLASIQNPQLMDEIIGQATGFTYPVILETTYPDYFERLVNGLLRIPPLEPAVCTEFNLLKKIDTKELIALWIRSPEPFNDPKIPLAILESEHAIRVLENGLVSNAYQALFSKDRSQIFLKKTGANITATTLKIRFNYLLWNGEAYDKETVETEDLVIA